DEGDVQSTGSADDLGMHAIGGNVFAYKDALGSRLSTIDIQGSWEGLRAQYVDSAAVPERRWIGALTEETVDQIASARGVHDLSQQMGYSVEFEMKMFRDAAKPT